MKAEDIEKYVSQLGHELTKQGIQEPIHLLLIGGAYMLLFTHSVRNDECVGARGTSKGNYQSMRGFPLCS